MVVGMMLKDDALNDQERDGRRTAICIQMRALPSGQIESKKNCWKSRIFYN